MLEIADITRPIVPNDGDLFSDSCGGSGARSSFPPMTIGPSPSDVDWRFSWWISTCPSVLGHQAKLRLLVLSVLAEELVCYHHSFHHLSLLILILVEYLLLE